MCPFKEWFVGGVEESDINSVHQGDEPELKVQGSLGVSCPRSQSNWNVREKGVQLKQW